QTVLVAIAFDRFMAVFKPLAYSKNDSKLFFYLVATIGISMGAVFTGAGYIGVDNSVKITICSAGAAASPGMMPFSLIWSATFVFLLFFFYILTIILIFRRIHNRKTTSNFERKEFKTQLKMFFTVSLVLLLCFICYGIPIIFFLVGLICNLGPNVRTWISLYSGFAGIVNAALNVFLYLFKHNEIRQCLIMYLGIGVFIRATYAVYANANSIAAFDRVTCLRVNSPQGFGVRVSQVVIVAIAFDRFMAIYKPLAYSKNNSRMFFYVTATVGISVAAMLVGMGFVGVDNSTKITVCSGGPAMSYTMVPINLAWSGSFLSSLFFFYILAIVLIFRRIHNKKIIPSFEKKEFRTQLRSFITVSLVLLLCFICYGIPMIFLLIGIVYDLGPSVRNWVALYSGFATIINATLNVFLYLFKHSEIKKCFISYLGGIFPQLKKNTTTTALFTIKSQQSKNSKI
ncbi:hypothetical protein FO519_009377, partial [Halicephalobus sp. NKZ332]